MSKWLTDKKRLGAWSKTGGSCGYCGKKLDSHDSTIDHLFPRSLGGDHDIDNLILSCRGCNSSKGTKTLEDYRLWLQWKWLYVELGLSINQMKWLLANTDICERFSPSKITFYFEEVASE